jgi:hypothetical protein
MKKIILAFGILNLSLIMQAQNLKLSSATSAKIAAISKFPNSKLNWYANVLKSKFSSSSNSGEVIIRERVQGVQKVQLGVNLVSSPSTYSNNGPTRNVEGTNSICVVQPKKINYLNPGEFILPGTFNFNYNPGDFIDPNTILNNVGNINPFNATGQRAPYKLGMSVFKANGVNEITITDFTNSPQAKINDSLKSKNFGSTIPNIGVLEVTELKSDLQLATSLETSAGLFLPLEELGIPADVTAGLKANVNGEANLNLKYFLVTYMQPMYNISVLTNPQYLFTNTASSASNASGAYISDVTYGRRAMFIFASADFSSVSSQFFEGGESISVTGGEANGLSLGVKGSGSISSSLKNSIDKFWGVLQGGNGNNVWSTYNDITAFHTEFKRFLTSSSASTYTAQTREVPLSYSLKRISDGAMIGTRSIGNFDETVSCNTNSYEVTMEFKGFTVNKVVEFPSDNEDDIYGNFHYDGYRVNGTSVSQGSYKLFEVTKGNAISKSAGQSYIPASVPTKVISKINKEDLKNSIFNFSETIYDWELVTAPNYEPKQPADLQFKFTEMAKVQIDRLAIGETYTRVHSIELYEGGNSSNAKITFNVEFKVKRN